MRCKLFVRLVFGVLLGCVSVLAQLDTGSVLGTVFDSSRAVVASARVAIENQGTGVTVETMTDGQGNFLVPVLPVGTYRVTVSSEGFKTQLKEDIRLRVSDRLRLLFALDPGSVTETVTVSGQAPLVETASSTLGLVVETEQIDALPLNGRNVSDLLHLVPGNVLRTGATKQAFNGISLFRQQGGLRFLLDGGDASRIDFDILDNTYGSSKGRISRSSTEAIQEFRVYTNSYSAEFGQTLGGVVNLITKSGSNQFHGSVFEYFRNEQLDSRNYFNHTGDKPPFRLNQYGGSLGGPIAKDKVFFFANYEGIQQRLGKVLNALVPTAEYRATVDPAVKPAVDMLPLPNGAISAGEPRLGWYNRGVADRLEENSVSAKIDYQASDKDSINFRYNLNANETGDFFGVARGQTKRAPGRLQLAKLTYNRVISPTVFNEAGFAFNRVRIDPLSAETDEILNFPIVGLGGGSAGVGPSGFGLQVANNSFTWLNTLSWVQGNHQLKVGAQIVRNQDNKAGVFQMNISYLSLDDFARNAAWAVSTWGQPRAGMRNTYNMFFIQDDYQVNQKVTLNLGMRYQYDTAPTESHGRMANYNPATGDLDPVGTSVMNAPATNFDPRIGFAISPFASNNTVIRFGYGIFHASLNAAMAQNIPNNLFQQTASVNALEVPGLKGFPPPANFNFVTGANLTALPRDLKQAYTQSWNFNIQQGLGEHAMLQVAYLGNRALHLTTGQDLNRVEGGVRPNPKFAAINSVRDDLTSTYNALQVSLRRRFSKGFRANVNYTWAHALDDDGIPWGSSPQDDRNPRAAYADSDSDVRHNLQFDYTYELASVPKLPHWIGGGWQINGITAMRSGLPVNPGCWCDPLGIGRIGSSRPDLVPGEPLYPADQDIPSRQFNPAAFSQPPAGRLGDAGRNILNGPAALNWDFSLFKNFNVGEGQTVQVRAEMFNMFNTPQFNNPGGHYVFPNFGNSTSTHSVPFTGFGSNRQIQFALRYSF